MEGAKQTHAVARSMIVIAVPMRQEFSRYVIPAGLMGDRQKLFKLGCGLKFQWECGDNDEEPIVGLAVSWQMERKIRFISSVGWTCASLTHTA
jgi:hypothetical protein